jgi:Glycosyl transferase family 2
MEKLKLPSVTVCIPTIPRRAALLERAIASIESQTIQPNEVIIIEDTEGQGAAKTRNSAWQNAKTDVVAFLDDDDEFLPRHLEACLTTMVKENAGLVYSWFELTGWADATPSRPDALATKLNGQLVHPLGVPFGHEQEQHYRLHAFIPITTVVRRHFMVKSGGYPVPGSSDWPREDCEDWGGHLRLLDVGCKFVHHPERTWRCHWNPKESTAGKPWTKSD